MLVKDEIVTIETPTGRMRIYLFLPVLAGRFPAIILWSEIYQVTAPIARLGRALASEGYLVACPEIYHEYVSGPLSYDDEGTSLGNKLKITKSLQVPSDQYRIFLYFYHARGYTFSLSLFTNITMSGLRQRCRGYYRVPVGAK